MQTALVYAINLVAFSLLTGTLTYWGSVWLATDHMSDSRQETPAGQPVPDTGYPESTAGNLFGIAQREQNVPVASSIDIKLLGVIAASGNRKGYAILKLDEKEILAIHEGEAIAPGVMLEEVRPKHIALERSGLRETLALPETALSTDFTSSPESQVVAASHSDQ